MRSYSNYSKCFSERELMCFYNNLTILQSVINLRSYLKCFFLCRSDVLCLRRVVAGAAQAEWDSDKGELRF